ncbi:MAG TPA: hypothetical protein VFG03_09125 [Telluria sp.]|nr:hypothetical protein [Telluria sp.]
MTPERENEYNELLAYVSLFASVVWKVSPAADMHPAKTIEKVVQQFGKSKALIGLRQAANDTIEETSRWSTESKAALDDTFRAAGLVTVSEVTRRYSSAYRRIIKRGLIRNDSEYYVVNAVLVDQSSTASDDERAHLQRLVDAFESKT